LFSSMQQREFTFSFDNLCENEWILPSLRLPRLKPQS
jgi:hypothetical protein